MAEINVSEKLKELLIDFTGIEDLDLSPETALSSDIGLASLDYFTFINEVEDEFEVSFSNKELGEMRTAGELVAAIESKLA